MTELPSVSQLPIVPTPILVCEWKTSEYIRKVIFWTLYSYLAFPLCLIKKDTVRLMPGQGSECQAGAAGAVREQAGQQEL